MFIRAKRIEDALTLAQGVEQIKAPILYLFSIPTRQRINQPRFTLFNEERHFIARADSHDILPGQ